MIYMPVKDWDASFIWYSTAKRTFSGHSFDWINGPHYLLADLPKLIPTFAASFSTLTQKWNELLPGSALLYFLFLQCLEF